MRTIAADDNAVLEKHRFDYYYRPGMQLRPPPQRAVPSPDWFEMRKRLFSDWIDVREVPAPTALTRRLDDHIWQGDEVMDAVVALSDRIGMGPLRAMLDQAIDHGIDTVESAPEELRRLFQEMERVPDWFDPELYERGRLLIVDCTPVGKLGASMVNSVMTSFGSAVSSAVGSTGRFKRSPYVRQVETQAFFQKLPLPDGIERFSETFATIVRVRLMHAQVRAGLRRRWGPEHFAYNGNPISNTDMCLGVPAYGAINLMIDASFGRKVTTADLDAVTMYWNYAAYRFGVSETILPRNGREAVEQFDYTLATYGKPSRWSDEVAESLVDYIHMALTESGSKLQDFVGRNVLFPLVLGFIMDIGGTLSATGWSSHERRTRHC